jgi:hypothetical protein
MLELRPNCRPKPSRLAAKDRRFSSLGLTPEKAVRLSSQFLASGKGCPVSVAQPLLAVLRNRKPPSAAAKLPIMKTYAKCFGNSCGMSTCVRELATILESALAENVGGGMGGAMAWKGPAATAAIPRPLTSARSTHLESYRCTKIQSNYLGMILLQKIGGGHPLLEITPLSL